MMISSDPNRQHHPPPYRQLVKGRSRISSPTYHPVCPSMTTAEDGGPAPSASRAQAQSQPQSLFEPELSTSAFEALERDFQYVIDRLEDDASMDRFRVEYERLFRVLKKSYNQEKRLVKKCRELEGDLCRTAAELEKAQNLGAERQTAIDGLKEDDAKANSLIEELKIRERDASNTADGLQTQVRNLEESMKEAKDEAAKHESIIAEVSTERKFLQTLLDEAENNAARLEEQLGSQTRRNDELTSTIDSLKHEVSSLSKSLADRSAALEDEQGRRQRLDEELKDLQTKLSAEEQRLTVLMHNRSEESDIELNNARTTIQNKALCIEDLTSGKERLEELLNSERAQTATTQEEMETFRAEMKAALAANMQISNEKARMEKKLDAEQKYIHQLQQQVDEARTASQESKQESELLTLQLDELRARETEAKNTVDASRRENDQILSQMQQNEAKMVCAQDDAFRMKQVIESLEAKLSAEKASCVRLETSTHHLQTERDEIRSKASELRVETEGVKNELQLRDIAIQGLTKKIIDLEKRAVEEKKNHEACRIEKRNLAKDVDALQAGIEALSQEKLELSQELDMLQSQVARMEATAGAAAKNEAIACRQNKPTPTKGMHILKIKTEKGELMSVDEISKQLVQKHRELLREQSRVRALTDELENPLNVHRWRKLEGSDPDTLDLIKKIQILQKRMIKKVDEASEKDLTIQQQNEVIAELRAVISRHPDLDQMDALSDCQNSISVKNKQMKSMAGELNMHHSQVTEYKREIDTLNAKLLDVKKKFFAQKQREAALATEKEIASIRRNVPVGDIEPSYSSASTTVARCDKTPPPLKHYRHRVGKSSSPQLHFMGGGFAVGIPNLTH